MRVAGLTSTGDWQFGYGRATYLQGSAAIGQNLVTRLKCFAGDWFLNIDAHIDWYTLLGRKNAQADIVREIVRVGQATYGVASIDSVEVEDIIKREATIRVKYTDIYQVENTLQLELTP